MAITSMAATTVTTLTVTHTAMITAELPSLLVEASMQLYTSICTHNIHYYFAYIINILVVSTCNSIG